MKIFIFNSFIYLCIFLRVLLIIRDSDKEIYKRSDNIIKNIYCLYYLSLFKMQKSELKRVFFLFTIFFLVFQI